MKVRAPFVSAVLLLVTATALQATTYTIALPSFATYYSWKAPRSYQVNFGRQFTSIQSVTMNWSGEGRPGEIWWGSGHQYVDYWVDNNFKATLLDGLALRGQTDSGDQLGSFNLSQPLTRVGSPSWSFLYDGVADLQIVMGDGSQPTVSYGDYTISNPSGHLSSVSLTIEGTAVPEPSGVATLLCAISGHGNLRLAKKKGLTLALLGHNDHRAPETFDLGASS